MKKLLVVLLFTFIPYLGYTQSYSINDKDTCYWIKIDITKTKKVKAIFDDYKIIHRFVLTELSTGDTLYVFDYNLGLAKWYIYRKGKLQRIREKRFFDCDCNLFIKNKSKNTPIKL